MNSPTCYNYLSFYHRRLNRIIPACILTGIIILVADIFLQCENTKATTLVRVFSLHQWYIQACIIAYLLSPFMLTTLKKYKVLAQLLLCGAFILLGSYCPLYEDHDWLRLNWVLYRMPVFILGMYVALHDLKLTYIYQLRVFSSLQLWYCR